MPRYAQTVLGLLFSGILLWVLFGNTDWPTLYASLRQVSPGWLVLSIAFAFGSFFTRVQRWRYVVNATQPVSFRHLFSAVQISLLINCLVPARLGDVVRGYILARLAQIPFARSLAFVALDRINDIFALVVVLFITVVSFPTNRDIRFAEGTFNNAEPFVVSGSLIGPVVQGLTILVLITILTLLFLYFQQGVILRFLDKVVGAMSNKLADRLHSTFLNLASGMHVFRSGAAITKSVLFSLLTWALVALSLAALLEAFNLVFPWFTPFLVLSMLGVFTSVTVTPGMVGQYHIPVVASLLMILPDMHSDEAKAVAIVAHLAALLPPVVLGIFSLLWERLSVVDLIPALKENSSVPR